MKGFQKGNKLGGRKKGSKNRATLLKEERRAIFEAMITQKWEDIVDQLPPIYVADQFMGKAPDKVEHSGEIKTSPIPPAAIKIIEEDLKKKKINEENESQ